MKPPEGQHITWQLVLVKCGRRACTKCKDKPTHGPYFYGYWTDSAAHKTRKFYHGKGDPREAQSKGDAA